MTKRNEQKQEPNMVQGNERSDVVGPGLLGLSYLGYGIIRARQTHLEVGSTLPVHATPKEVEVALDSDGKIENASYVYEVQGSEATTSHAAEVDPGVEALVHEAEHAGASFDVQRELLAGLQQITRETHNPFRQLRSMNRFRSNKRDGNT